MSFTQWNQYRRRRTQKRKALQLLTLSGVVRPSTSEPRYTVSAIRAGQALSVIRQPIPGTVRSQSPATPHQAPVTIHRLRLTTRAWVEQSRQYLRQVYWDMGKIAGRFIGFPSTQ